MDPGARWRSREGQPGIAGVQVGDPNRLGKNHKEAHHGDCGWGGDHHGGHKGPWVWCVIEGPPLVGLVLSKEPAAVKLVEILIAKAPALLAPQPLLLPAHPRRHRPPQAARGVSERHTRRRSIEPLLAKDGARLVKLQFDESQESSELLDALSAKPGAIKTTRPQRRCCVMHSCRRRHTSSRASSMQTVWTALQRQPRRSVSRS